ncbi:hypothetical protein VTK73DRAFT_2612 [Phialemonium thermophilum]|uniref:Uncharacterized protein n=1 Tax=Phialemonium thermophilum TaxID=223376 RepID=A0ABR3VQX3_9PEZI
MDRGVACLEEDGCYVALTTDPLDSCLPVPHDRPLLPLASLCLVVQRLKRDLPFSVLTPPPKKERRGTTLPASPSRSSSTPPTKGSPSAPCSRSPATPATATASGASPSSTASVSSPSARRAS